jgi:hypothetical protein
MILSPNECNFYAFIVLLPNNLSQFFHSILKFQNASWVQWCKPVVPATLEAEMGGSLEPQNARSAWAKE